jgi:flagellar motility protein MotE (MotC chaperone)
LNETGHLVEVVRQWITPVSLMTILGFVVRWQLGLRKLRIEAKQVDVNAEQVTQTAEADIRDHYADEVRQLREQLNGQGERHRQSIASIEARYQEALTNSERKHEECARDRDHLRDKVQALKDLVAGLRRIITQTSASQAIRLSSDPASEIEIPDDIREAAERVDRLFALPSPGPQNDH